MKLILLLLALLTAAVPAWAAPDANGYTAKYEVRAGNITDSTTNFDLASAVAQACDQTITTATTPTTDWSAIVWTNNVICIQVGDHTGRGTFSTGAAGTSGTRKVIKGVQAGGGLADEPWSVASGSRVKVRNARCTSHDFVVVTRLWIVVNETDNPKVQWSGCDSGILHENLIDPEFGATPSGSAPLFHVKREVGDSSDFLTLQNSVIRNSGKKAGSDLHCVNLASVDVRIVNNEIYNCGGDGIVADNGSNPLRLVIENNDIYQTSDYLIGCDGSPGTTCNCGEDGIDIKDNSTSSSDLIRIVHNRIEGWRTTYSSCGGSNSGGYGINTGGTSENYYLLAQNNIIFSTAHGINFNTVARDQQDSVIGNILYDITHQNAPDTICPGGSSDMCAGIAIAFIPFSGVSNEWYLNTVISAERGVWWSGGTTNDVRCNVFIDIADMVSGTPGAGTVVDFNVFYGTDEVHTFGGVPSNINNALNTRANSTAYSLNAIIRTTAPPPGDGTAGDFLNKVTTAGTTAATPPAYPTTLGGTVTDGSAVLKAFRGPRSFKRKLRTVAGGETVVIPYERKLISSVTPENAFCPSGSEANAIGGRAGIGVNDIKPPNPPFDVDLFGKSR